MPSWNIHLEAGTRLADKLHLRGQSRQEFLLGCLLPDINNGYVNQPRTVYAHEMTHYARNDKSSLNFYADYQSQIKSRDPLYMGYLFHLFTDGYFNYDFYRNFKRRPDADTLTKEEKRAIKHHDFWLFDTNFHHVLDLPKDSLSALAKKASAIEVISIAPDDIEEVDAILHDDSLNDDIKGEDYLFYNAKTLASLLDSTVKEFIYQYLEQDTPGPRPAKELHDEPPMAKFATTSASSLASSSTSRNSHA